MAYELPTGTSDISVAIKTTIVNALNHIKSSISGGHGWDDNDATAATHARDSGIWSSSVLGISDGQQTDITLTFDPKMVTFHWYAYSGNYTEMAWGFGFKTTSDNGSELAGYNGSQFHHVHGAAAVIIYKDGQYQELYVNAQCILGTNKFTLDWAKSGTPVGSIYIMWTAYGA